MFVVIVDDVVCVCLWMVIIMIMVLISRISSGLNYSSYVVVFIGGLYSM